jgi:hypothetical protein
VGQEAAIQATFQLLLVFCRAFADCTDDMLLSRFPKYACLRASAALHGQSSRRLHHSIDSGDHPEQTLHDEKALCGGGTEL